MAAKSGLNREMRHVRFGAARRVLGYKSLWHGGRVVAVPPAYTSQTCSACGQYPEDDPQTRHLEHGRDEKHFRCPLCGYEEDADINAARNIEREADRLAAKMDREAVDAVARESGEGCESRRPAEERAREGRGSV